MRTAQFGVALTFCGPLNLRKHAKDFSPIDSPCPCPTCRDGVSKAMLHHTATHETAAAHAITLHNLAFQARVMGQARDSILDGTFPAYLLRFFADYFGNAGYPEWCVNALRSVGVDLLEGNPHTEDVKGDGGEVGIFRCGVTDFWCEDGEDEINNPDVYAIENVTMLNQTVARAF